MVAWNTQTAPATAEVGYRRFNLMALPLTPRVHLEAFPTDDARTPAVAYSVKAPDSFIVTWTTYTGTEAQVTGVLVRPGTSSRFNWAQGPNIARWGPALATGELGFFAAYPAAPISNQSSSHIYGRTWRVDAVAVPASVRNATPGW